MKNLKQFVTIIAIVIVPLTILGCGVKGDPLVPSAQVAAP